MTLIVFVFNGDSRSASIIAIIFRFSGPSRLLEHRQTLQFLTQSINYSNIILHNSNYFSNPHWTEAQNSECSSQYENNSHYEVFSDQIEKVHWRCSFLLLISLVLVILFDSDSSHFNYWNNEDKVAYCYKWFGFDFGLMRHVPALWLMVMRTMMMVLILCIVLSFRTCNFYLRYFHGVTTFSYN